MKEFFYYLDAWCYCFQYHLPTDSIKRRDWKTWVVDLEEQVYE